MGSDVPEKPISFCSHSSAANCNKMQNAEPVDQVFQGNIPHFKEKNSFSGNTTSKFDTEIDNYLVRSE